MILRTFTLATSAALLTLAGCATPQADPADPTNQRLGSIESRLQAEAGSTQNLIGELGKKVEALSGELRRMRETGASQADSSAAAQRALAERMEKVEKRAEQGLNDAAGETRAAAAQAHDTAQRLEGLSAQVDQRIMDTTLEQQADSEELAERLEDTEFQLESMAGQIEEALAQAGAVQAALPALREKTAALEPRLNGYDARLAALDKRLDEVARMAQDAFDATGLGQRKIFGKVIESITLTEDKTLFPINSPNLGEQDMAKLDALAIRLKVLGTNYHLQIQGHTDGFGADDYNYELGKARAEVVKNYLNEKGGIPLLRMSTISYGSLESAGYAAKSNRRIVVQVLQ
jgi:outer membrane protein OmpA-like peptidoglycan-associated protein